MVLPFLVGDKPYNGKLELKNKLKYFQKRGSNFWYLEFIEKFKLEAISITNFCTKVKDIKDGEYGLDHPLQRREIQGMINGNDIPVYSCPVDDINNNEAKEI